MTLYDAIVSTYGGGLSSKDRYNKQKDLYTKLGSPLGNYTGSAAQNIWLLNNKAKWATAGQPAQAPQPAQPAQPVQPPTTLQQAAIDAVVKLANPDPKKFTDLLPYDSFVKNPLVKQMATESVMPDIIRNQATDMGTLRGNQGATGVFRGGQAEAQQYDLANQYARSAKEQINAQTAAGQDELNKWWNTMYDQYVKDPNTYTAPDITKILNK